MTRMLVESKINLTDLIIKEFEFMNLEYTQESITKAIFNVNKIPIVRLPSCDQMAIGYIYNEDKSMFWMDLSLEIKIIRRVERVVHEFEIMTIMVR